MRSIVALAGSCAAFALAPAPPPDAKPPPKCGTNAAGLLADNFATAYNTASGGQMGVGLSGVTGHSKWFTSAGDLLNYLPADGPDGRLLANYVNPTTANARRKISSRQCVLGRGIAERAQRR